MRTKKGNNDDEFWLAATDVANEGVWTVNSDLTCPAICIPWKRQEPNNLEGEEHCTAVRPSKKAIDKRCYLTSSIHICQRPNFDLTEGTVILNFKII